MVTDVDTVPIRCQRDRMAAFCRDRGIARAIGHKVDFCSRLDPRIEPRPPPISLVVGLKKEKSLHQVRRLRRG
jgi:hypothetical protein